METMPYFQGLGLGASLIVAIGAQNAFVLTRAISQNHHLAVAGVCFACDALLISLGVLGLGGAVAAAPLLREAAAWGGALFLAWFGFGALVSAIKPGTLEAGAGDAMSLKAALATTLAVSLLNPHAWLDTVVMLGGMSGNYHGTGRYAFGLGAATASLAWFLTLGSSGRLLAPLFRRPAAWRVLEAIVCLTVWSTAASLVRSVWPA